MWPDAPSSVAGLGLGYGIAIAVAVLFLVSSIILASYVCIRAKVAPFGGRALSSAAPGAAAAAAAAARDVEDSSAAGGLDGPAIEALYQKFVASRALPLPAGPCPICLAEYEDGEALRRAQECGHCFHAECVDEWLRVSATCPLCRSSPVPTPMGTPLSELIPLAAHAR